MVSYLTHGLYRFPHDSISRIFSAVRSTIIDVTTITSIVAELSSSEEDLAQESVQVGISLSGSDRWVMSNMLHSQLP